MGYLIITRSFFDKIDNLLLIRIFMFLLSIDILFNIRLTGEDRISHIYLLLTNTNIITPVS